jgi:hypothetical protein
MKAVLLYLTLFILQGCTASDWRELSEYHDRPEVQLDSMRRDIRQLKHDQIQREQERAVYGRYF